MPTNGRTCWADTDWAMSSHALVVLVLTGMGHYRKRVSWYWWDDVLWAGQGPSLWYPLWSELICGPFSQGAHEPPVKAVLVEDAGVLWAASLPRDSERPTLMWTPKLVSLSKCQTLRCTGLQIGPLGKCQLLAASQWHGIPWFVSFLTWVGFDMTNEV